MSVDSHDITEIARKNERMILRGFARPGQQQQIAASAGLSGSTISRMKDGDIERFSSVLAACGLKVVDIDRVCVKQDEYMMMTRITARALANEEMARALLFEDPE